MSSLTIQIQESLLDSLMAYALKRKQSLQVIAEEALASYIATQTYAEETLPDDEIVGMFSLGADASAYAKDLAKQQVLQK